MALEAYIFRKPSTDQGSPGIFSIPDLQFSCYSIELPWRDNKCNLSCIPKGRYLCKHYHSTKFGDVYILIGVDGRSYILMHTGNWAGDITKGYVTNSQGCILIGSKLMQSWPSKKQQIGVFNSRITLRKFKSLVGNNNFYINII